MIQKRELRQHMQQQRAAYTAAELQEWSSRIAGHFFDYFALPELHTVHVFLPIVRKKEIDTWQIIRQLQMNHAHIRIAVSVSDFSTGHLDHFWLRPDTKLQENKWGIPEPVQAQAIAVTEIDMVLVPLLAFDPKGHRVGYGKGFYDRFLASCRPGAVKIGLSLESQGHEVADVHEGDVLLDYVITPAGVIPFRH
ncbi:MAG: 5-formyltetrahydrofolate cyclo-ligase [Adhaeribacter sp.]